MGKKAKCEKCEYCEIITSSDVIVCSYLKELNKSLLCEIKHRPIYCSRFSREKKRGAK